MSQDKDPYEKDKKSFVVVGLIFIAGGAYGLVAYPDHVGEGWVTIGFGSAILAYIAITGRV